MRRRTMLAAPLALAVAGGRSDKLPKANVIFQHVPNEGRRCADCRLFLSGPRGPGPGECQVVEGAIVQDGWCVLFERPGRQG